MSVLTTDPYLVLKDLIENNTSSPDGSWIPSVNEGWLEHRRMKNYQIVIQPTMHMDQAATLDYSNRTSTAFFDIVLYAPTRSKRWSLYRAVKTVLNDPANITPMDATGYAGVESSEVQQVLISGLGGIDLRWIDEECGPAAEENCKGYRVHITVMLRWEE